MSFFFKPVIQNDSVIFIYWNLRVINCIANLLKTVDVCKPFVKRGRVKLTTIIMRGEFGNKKINEFGNKKVRERVC